VPTPARTPLELMSTRANSTRREHRLSHSQPQ
jgi:hypothetical protein